MYFSSEMMYQFQNFFVLIQLNAPIFFVQYWPVKNNRTGSNLSYLLKEIIVFDWYWVTISTLCSNTIVPKQVWEINLVKYQYQKSNLNATSHFFFKFHMILFLIHQFTNIGILKFVHLIILGPRWLPVKKSLDYGA